MAQAIVWVAQKIAVRSDSESNDTRVMRLRQMETYLSIATALVRAITVAIVGYIAWRALNPVNPSTMSGSAAAIGAGAFFVVIAGQTVGIILRDLTAGSIMITEGWFKIGDFIKIEPFWDVSGVVERFTLRSTRIRSLSGEIVWVHNQHITGVHVTPRGVRTLAVEVFVVDKERGEKAIRQLIAAIPKGKTMLAKPLKIVATEKWENGVWRITVVGQTTPGRDWLIQDYFVEAVKALDKGKKRTERLLANAPFARFADPDAERKFNRAVRVKTDK
jgi:small conductance mechanosensitive channel